MAEAVTAQILLVEDEPALLRLLEDYVSRLGFRVAAFRTAREGYQQFAAAPAAFSVGIVDLSLPDMRGEELSRKLRELNPALHLILLSGHPLDPAALEQLERTRVEFLQKPFAPAMLIEAVRRATGP